MKALCAISSIEFNVEHFPGSLYSREISHPVFYLPQKKLLSYLGKWSSNGLTPTDSYLLFLALLNSSELVQFRVPVFRNNQTDSIVAQNMEYLSRTVIKLNTVQTPSFVFPQFAITPETRFLTNIHHWIEAWESKHKEFGATYKSAHDSAKLIRRESALERLIKNPHKEVHTYASSIAEWAQLAGNFPTYNVLNPYTRNTSYISCADYWKSIIIKCASDITVYNIDRQDILDILEHCEQNISYGTIFSNALFTILRRAIEKQNNFLGGNINLINGSYEFIQNMDNIENANIQAMIASAPPKEPFPLEYPTKLSYLKAKMRWQMSQINPSPKEPEENQ